MTAINYLFPPDQIHTLPTWRFVVHFVLPAPCDPAALAKAVAGMKSADWKIITFPFGLDAITCDPNSRTVDVAIEVSEDRREKTNSLANMPELIRASWAKNSGLAAASGETLLPVDFTEMFVDANFVPRLNDQGETW